MTFSKFNIALLILLCVQLTLVIVKTINVEEEVVIERPMTELKKDQINQITVSGLVNGGELSVQLKKVNNVWVLPERFNFPVKQHKVHELLETILSIKMGKAVVRKVASQSRLMVSDHTYSRKISWNDGKEGFYLGVPAGASHSLSHVRKFGEDDVYQAEIRQYWQVGVATIDWIDKNFMDLDHNEVVEFKQVRRINYQRDMLHVRKVNGTWRIQGELPSPDVNEENDPFNPVSFSSYLKEQVYWDLEEVIGKGAPYPASSRLTDAPIVLSFTLRDKKTDQLKTEKLHIGLKRPGHEDYYVRSTGSDWVYTVSPKKVATIAPRSDFFGDAYRKKRQSIQRGDPNDDSRKESPNGP